MEKISYLKQLRIPLQINTTVSQHNVEDLPAIAELAGRLDTVLWSVFFPIPTGRAVGGLRMRAIFGKMRVCTSLSL